MGAVELNLTKQWVEMRNSAKLHNLSALLRLNNLAGMYHCIHRKSLALQQSLNTFQPGKLTREPILQKRVLKLTDVVVQGNTRALTTKR